MMKLCLLLCQLFISAVCRAGIIPASDGQLPPPGITGVQADSVKALISRFPANSQFALALLDGEQTTFYGLLRTGDSLRLVSNADSVFEIGSIGKVFTSSLLARMAEGGQLALNDPVSAYLDFPVNDSLGVSFIQLANHTSGLPRLPPSLFLSAMMNPDNPYKDYDREKLRNYISREMSLQREAGTAYEYSNLGAGMLGYVLENISGQSFEEMLQQLVCQPLQMPHTTTRKMLVEKILVKGLNPAGQLTSNWNLAALVGAGGIFSTVADLSRFVRANFNDTLDGLRLQRQSTFVVNDKLEIALGWHILKREPGRDWYWHNGGTGGYRSSMAMDVEQQKAVILLTNMSAGHPLAGDLDQLVFFLLEEMYE